MNHRIRKDFRTASFLLAIFVIFTILLRFVNTDSIAPDGSSVGFSFLNQSVKSHLPFDAFFYALTQKLGVLAISLALGFAILGTYQWWMRKKIFLVDADILCLGLLFAVTVGFYCLFECICVNVRPILIGAKAENSYPSSHTVLSVVVFVGVMPLFRKRLSGIKLSLLESFLYACLFFTVFGRLKSGVHWLTDLVGGILLSLSLLLYYFGLLRHVEMRQK